MSATRLEPCATSSGTSVKYGGSIATLSRLSEKGLYLSSPVVGEYYSAYMEAPGLDEGCPIVFCVHGRPGDSRLMLPFARWAESNGFGFYAYDQFGVGRTNASIRFTPDSDALKIVFSDEMGRHLINAKSDKLFLVVHSFGGVIASLHFEKHGVPSDLKLLVLSGFCPVRAEFLDYNNQRLDRLTAEVGISRAEEIFFERHICNPQKLSLPQLASIKAAPFGSVVIEPSYLHQLRMIACPSILTFGENDILSDRQACLCLDALQDGRAIKVPSAAHYPFLENDEFYFTALDRALRAIESLR